ncbi:nitroreductase family protein [Bifidobacterium mongoliense]|uniref:nitroreductase family protein n=1 Tax=Bifidobacterium mongoliense TaxID=518643 RepID=UPI0030ECCBCC
MRNKIKRFVPVRLKHFLLRIFASTNLMKEFLLQYKRYNRSYSGPILTDLVQVETKLTFLEHQLEKGLSHESFRLGFGKGVISEIGRLLPQLFNFDDDYRQNRIYLMLTSAMHEYITRHRDEDYDITFAQQSLPPTFWKDAINDNAKRGGSLLVHRVGATAFGRRSLDQIMEDRHSVREFSKEPIQPQQILSVVQSSVRAPSVCNRQPARVRIVMNKTLIEKLLELQGGLNDYPLPPCLMLVTADLRAFLWPEERNEGFIDGGIFSMSLLLALEEHNFAACPLNTSMMTIKKENETRRLLSISDHEFLIMYVAVGHFQETPLTCISERLRAEDITEIVL